MIPQIPYGAIGMGVAALLGVWAFIVSDDVRHRALILGIPTALLLEPMVFHSRIGRLASLIGWMIYGVGCLVYLRYKGVAVR